MGNLLPAIRAVLVELIERIDSGRCSTTEQQERMFLELVRTFTDKEERVSKYKACQYLNMSRASFDNKVREGLLPKGRKISGWKELSWSLKELDDYIRTCKESK